MKFTCADLATVATGHLFVPVERLYEIYNFLTGDNLYTHQLPRAFRFADLHIDEQFPTIAPAMRAAKGFINPQTYQAMLAQWEKEYGQDFAGEVKPMEGWLHVDALSELETMVPQKKIVVVQP